MKHLKRFESTSKTIRHREYCQLYKDYFIDMLSGRTGFNCNTVTRGSDLTEILGEVVGGTYDDVVYDVDYLEKVKQQFKETKEDFDELSQILKDLEEEYNIESVIYTIKPYGKYKQEISYGVESSPAFRTNPVKIKTSLDTEDAVFDVYIGLSEVSGSGLYQTIQNDTMKGVTDFIKILESKGSKVEIILFTGSVRKLSGDEMEYKSYINLKFNYKY